MAEGYLLNGMVVAVKKLTPANSAFVTINGITGSVTFPTRERDEIETTGHGDTDRTYIAGLRDSGDISFDLNWSPKSPTDVYLLALEETGEPVHVQITTPGLNGNTTNTYSETWNAFVKTYERSASHDDKAEATVTFRISGKVNA